MSETGSPAYPPLSPPLANVPPSMPPGIEKPPSTWPVALGILCIVLGVLGTFSGFCGVVAGAAQPFFFEAMKEGLDDEHAQRVMESVKQFQPYNLLLPFASILLSIALTAGGFGLTLRRRWSRPTLRHWSWLKMILVVAAVWIGWASQRAMLDAASQESASPPPLQFRMMGGLFGSIGLVIGLVWGWGLPVFNLVWLGRAKIRSEVNEWA